MSQIQITGEAKIRDLQGPVVANSGVITALDGLPSQYVRGDGTLADIPSVTGGGASVSYYLNGSVSQGTFGGSTYYQLGENAITGVGTNFSTSTDGLLAQFITDADVPDVTEIPSGNWNIEFYMGVSASSGALASFYVEVYKYDGTTFTLIASNVGTPEVLTNTTTIDAYFTSVAMPLTSLAVTDRIAIRVYASVAGKTVTMYTEDNRLCQVVTTFSRGMLSLNSLTDQQQYLTVGTAGTDFNIVSALDTHTFNIPVASATNTGKLSAGDWTKLNTAYNDSIVSAEVTGTTTKTLTLTQQDAGTITASWTDDNTDAVTSVFGRTGAITAQSGDYTTSLVTEGTNLYFTDARARLALSATSPLGYNNTTGVFTIQVANTSQNGYLSSTDWNTFNNKQNALTLTTTGTSGAATLVGSTLNIPNYGSALSGYVPYTGATSAVNLGANNLTAGVGFFTSGQTYFANIGADINGGYSQTYRASDDTYHPYRIIGGSGTIAAKTFTLNNSGASLNATLFGTAASFSSSVTSETFIQTSGIGTYLKAGGYTLIGGSGGDYGSVGYNVGYTSTSGSYNYLVNDFSSIIRFDSGGFNFLTAPTGSIGAAISYTPRVIFANNGNVLIGTGIDSGFKLDVNGTGRFTGSLTIGSSLIVNTGAGSTFRAVNSGANNVEIGNYSSAGYRQLDIGASTINLQTTTAGGTLATTRLSISTTGSATFSGNILMGYNNALIFGNSPYRFSIYRESAGNLITYFDDEYDIAGSELRFRMRTAGTPINALTIYGNGASVFSNTITAGGGISSTAASAFVNAYSTNPANDAIISAYWSATSALEMRYNANTAIAYIQTLYQQVSGQPFGDIHIRQNSGGTMVTRMLFKNDGGKVLINTLSEVSGGGTLQVNGDVNINGSFKINGTIIGGGGGSGVTGSGSTNYITKWTGSTTLGNSLIYDTGNYVSINSTTNPNTGGFTNTTLLVKQVADGVVGGGLHIEQSSNTNVAFFGFTGSEFRIGTSYRSTGSYQPIVFSTGGPNRLRIENNGNILIATDTDNGYKLQINGSASFAYGFTSVYRGSTGANDILVGNTGSTFYVGGSVTATGGFFDTSDSRLKTLITDNHKAQGIENVTAKLYLKNGKQELGYYAQDLQEILPSAVSEGSDGFLTLSYSQVHTAKIAQLEAKVAQLEELIKTLIK